MSYQNKTDGKHAELSKLAGAIAGQLPDYIHQQDSADWQEKATFCHVSKPVWFCIRYYWQGKGDRLMIDSERPPRWPHCGFSLPHGHSITCNKHRPAQALARDIERRFLAAYAPAYVQAYQKAHRDEQRAKQVSFEREQIRQCFGGDWEADCHSYHGEDNWTEQNTGLRIKWSYRDRPTFSIETPNGEPARLMAYALRYAVDTIKKEIESKTA